MKIVDPTKLNLDIKPSVEKAPDVAPPEQPTSWSALKNPPPAKAPEVNFAASIDRNLTYERRAPMELPFDEAVKTDAQTDGWFQGAEGRLYDPATRLSDVAPVLPNNGKPATHTKIVILGIMTSAAMQAEIMQNIANKEGVAVIGIRNATQGFLADSVQTLLVDKLGIGTNPATETLTRVMKQSLKDVQDGIAVTIPEARVPYGDYEAHSHGAIILSRALEETKTWLMSERGFTQARAEQALSAFQGETYGGAAMNYPDGARLTHNVNVADVVPMGLGVALPFSHEGRGATVNYFFDVDLPTGSTSAKTDGRGFANYIDSAIHGIAPGQPYEQKMPEKKIFFQLPRSVIP
jgi:hypothetical protein